jgi:hypothetical protein
MVIKLSNLDPEFLLNGDLLEVSVCFLHFKSYTSKFDSTSFDLGTNFIAIDFLKDAPLVSPDCAICILMRDAQF